MKVSVIVPVYNVEKYLNKCLDSLVNQTFEEYEIIIVNDGSPDNSQAIIDKYKKEYPNKIKAYQKENGGVSSARNLGLNESEGKYVTFVDSDDYVTNDFIEKLYNKVTENDYDIAQCDLIYVNQGGTEYKKATFKADLNNRNQMKSIMYDFYPIVTNKIFKKSIITKDNYFKEGIWFEDVEFLYRLFAHVNSIGNVKEGLYYYYQNDSSISHTYNKKLYNHIDNWNDIFSYYKSKGIYQEYREILEYSFTRYVYGTFIKRACYFQYEQYLEALDYAIKNVKEKTSIRIFNKYYYKSLKGIYLLFFNRFIGKLLYKIVNK